MYQRMKHFWYVHCLILDVISISVAGIRAIRWCFRFHGSSGGVFVPVMCLEILHGRSSIFSPPIIKYPHSMAEHHLLIILHRRMLEQLLV